MAGAHRQDPGRDGLSLAPLANRKARPPSFTLFGNQLDALPEAYLRYLTNGLREAFNLKGAPLRFSVRNSKNPYAKKK